MILVKVNSLIKFKINMVTLDGKFKKCQSFLMIEPMIKLLQILLNRHQNLMMGAAFKFIQGIRSSGTRKIITTSMALVTIHKLHKVMKE